MFSTLGSMRARLKDGFRSKKTGGSPAGEDTRAQFLEAPQIFNELERQPPGQNTEGAASGIEVAFNDGPELAPIQQSASLQSSSAPPLSTTTSNPEHIYLPPPTGIPSQQPKIDKSSGLYFALVADGTSLLIWRPGWVSHITHIFLPTANGQPLRGHKCSLPGTCQIVQVAGGSKSVAVITYQASRFQLILFTSTGDCVSQRDLHATTRPLSLSISRDDTRVAIGSAQTVEICSILGSGSLSDDVFQVPLMTDKAARKLEVTSQRTNFYTSREFVCVSQIKGHHPIHQTVRTLMYEMASNGHVAVLTPPRYPLQVTSNAGTITGAFITKSANGAYNLVFTSKCTGKHATLWRAGSEHPPQTILRDKPIGIVAQGIGAEYGSFFVFGDSSGRVWRLDTRDMSCRLLNNFSGDSRGLSEPRTMSCSSDGLLQVFWWTKDGRFVLYEVDLNGIKDPREIAGVGELYLAIERGSTLQRVADP
ncbi:hypothetical protein QBC35DRAFT_505100 [Podospora australis]|uniref:Uncharacterized protein n=1 Tax=Podospora australis TaxID=1536484 RepID=A0AAN6WMZ8_9PEZI|nr:hypothetical protein QBC35DRAFT_505100 [Podospora australis]